MNKQGIEIMSDLNQQIKDLEEIVESREADFNEINNIIGCEKWKDSVGAVRELKEELDMEKEENELYMEYLDVENAEEAKRLFKMMKNQIDELERKNEQLKFENSMHVKDLLKIKKKAIGDGLEYLLD